MSDPVLEFQGQYRFLSNFHPCQIEWLGYTYPTVEHAFQAANWQPDCWQRGIGNSLKVTTGVTPSGESATG